MKSALPKLTLNNATGQRLVGVFEGHGEPLVDGQLPDGRGRHIAILAHGVGVTKNYCFFPTLAKRLPCASVRFDFRGAGESDGKFTYDGYSSDADDIKTIIAHLRSRNWKPLALMGHSRGANDILLYAQNNPYDVRFVVNISGRYLLRYLLNDFESQMNLLKDQ
ncbi:Alpha/Beta hydrolase protein, partial [Blyttiomyces helicus]